MLEIMDANRHFKTDLATFARRGLMAMLAERAGVTVPPPDQVAPGPVLQARVNHNRWIVDCPDCSCAEYAWPDERLMMCCHCWNGSVGGKWRRVQFPTNRALIEATLKARPVPHTRNWSPGESLATLRTENRTHKLPEGV